MSTRTVLPPEERKKELLEWLQAIYDVSNPEYIEKNGLEGQPSLSELYKKVTGRPCEEEERQEAENKQKEIMWMISEILGSINMKKITL